MTSPGSDADGGAIPADRLAELKALDRVEWSAGSGWNGGCRIAVHETEEVLVSCWEPGSPEVHDTILSRPAGTYAAVLEIALAGIKRLPRKAESPPYMDYGTDSVRVVRNGRKRTVAFGFPVDQMADLQADLRAAAGLR